jgi:hypothetical protein
MKDCLNITQQILLILCNDLKKDKLKNREVVYIFVNVRLKRFLC